MKTYDVLVIGSGAGLLVVQAAVQRGLRCALAENSKFGGTCLTRGCIPSKMLTTPADAIRQAEQASKIGVNLRLENISWDSIGRRMRRQIDYCRDIEHNLTQIENLDIYRGNASFTGKKTLRVRHADGSFSEELTAAHIVIAAGARPLVPAVEGLEDTGYMTYETFFDSDFPKTPWNSLLIIGGGAVAAEFAHIFSAMGTAVTMIQRNARLLPKEDEDISAFAQTQFENNAITVLKNSQVVRAYSDNNEKHLVVRDNLSGEETDVRGEAILAAAGVQSNADLLRVDNAGIATDEHGWIQTDAYLQTGVPGVWALGDINGKYPFRHKANYEAELWIHNFFSPKKEQKEADYTKVPWAVFTHPQIAHLGMTERQAFEAEDRLLIGYNHYSSVAKGIAMGFREGAPDDGFVKIIADRHMKLLGVHIAGPEASVLIQPFVYLMNTTFACREKEAKKPRILSRGGLACPRHGSFEPLFHSMVIHPSLSELTAWAVGNMEWKEKPR